MSREPAEVEADIVGLSHDGQGIAALDGERVFVPGALPGERALLTIERRRRRRRRVNLIDVLAPAADRVEPPCEYFGRCGGCAVQHLSYEAQVRFKESVVRDAFERISDLKAAEWLAPLTGDEPEPLEIIEWPTGELARLREASDFTDARSVLATYLFEERMAT